MKKKISIITIILIVIITVAYFLFFRNNKGKTEYTFAEIKKGNLSVVITSSGTLEATSTVDVGTQVSGKISKLYVDFNSEVKKGQLLAVIDTVNLVAQVSDAKANLSKAKAEYNQKVVIHEKNKKLYEKEYLSELDFIQSQTDVEASLASLKSAESALERAKTNLDYAYIYAPIAGKIINRSVEQGQTVAASLSTPTLFTIAEDLSSMRILASVDESDIGQIKEGQKVKFTVQAYSDKSFDGIVTQIRLKASVSSNVVNYTVVIQANNSEKLLLPGMTATVDFYVDDRDDVLLVPNTALKFEPSEDLLNELRNDMEKERASLPDSIKNKFKNMPPPNMLPTGEMPARENMKKVYYLDSNGKMKMCPLFTGLTDGKNTEIVRSRELREGMKVITGSNEETTSVTTKSTNALNPGPQTGGPPPPMM
jgi:HlyD family secretion protein